MIRFLHKRGMTPFLDITAFLVSVLPFIRVPSSGSLFPSCPSDTSLSYHPNNFLFFRYILKMFTYRSGCNIQKLLGLKRGLGYKLRVGVGVG